METAMAISPQTSLTLSRYSIQVSKETTTIISQETCKW